MKKLPALCLLALISVVLQLPASAGLTDWFQRWDYNHNNCWSWQEFRDANVDWCRRHRTPVSMQQLHRQYVETARMNGGCVRMQNVQGLRAWD